MFCTIIPGPNRLKSSLSFSRRWAVFLAKGSPFILGFQGPFFYHIKWISASLILFFGSRLGAAYGNGQDLLIHLHYVLWEIDPRDYITTLGKQIGHNPFANLNDYFYDIRKRMDKLLNKLTGEALYEKIPSREVRLIKCVVEAQTLSIHYLSYLLKIGTTQIDHIPKYQYSNPIFSK